MEKIIHLLLLIVVSVIFISCDREAENTRTIITYIGAQSISVPEPSGLDITFDRSGFWTVSDENSSIYRLDSEGNVVKTIRIDGEDLEGITVIDELRIAVVLERTREIIIIDTTGNELQRVKMPLEGELNSGLEGISYNEKNGHFYLLNEKKPSLLIELNKQLEILSIDTLHFSKDVSGIFYDNKNNLFWILSDENQLVAKTGMNRKPLELINVDIAQPEGIAIDFKGNRLYIISDNTESLYIYRMN